MRTVTGEDGREYIKQGGEYVPVDSAANPPQPPQPGRMPGAGGAIMEGVNAFNRGALAIADMPVDLFNAVGRVSDGAQIPTPSELAGRAGIGNQAGYMDPTYARGAVEAAGELVPAAAGLVSAGPRNLEKPLNAVAEIMGMGTQKLSGVARNTAAQSLIQAQNATELAGGTPSKMVDRLLESLDVVNPTATPKTIVDADTALPGQLLPEQVQRLMGKYAPPGMGYMTRGQQKQRLATNMEQEIQAQEMILKERQLSQGGTPEGLALERMYNAQQRIPGQAVKDRLGIPLHQGFTPKVMGDLMNDVGLIMDAYARDVGKVDDVARIVPALDELVELSEGITGQPKLIALVERIKSRIKVGGGSLTGEEWQSIRQDIGKQMRGAQTNKQYDLGENLRLVQDELTAVLEEAVGPGQKADMQEANAKWGLIEDILNRDGAIKKDKSLSNARILSAMNKGNRKKHRMRNMETEELYNLFDTFNTLSDTVKGQPGTAATLMANESNAVKGLLKAGANAAGIPIP